MASTVMHLEPQNPGNAHLGTVSHMDKHKHLAIGLHPFPLDQTDKK